MTNRRTFLKLLGISAIVAPVLLESSEDKQIITIKDGVGNIAHEGDIKYSEGITFVFHDGKFREISRILF